MMIFLALLGNEMSLSIVALRAFQDNYMWLLCDQGGVVVIDPGEARPVLDYLKQKNTKLSAILLTHKHADHTAGVAELLLHYPDVLVCASKQDAVAGVNFIIDAHESFEVPGLSQPVTVIKIPGHTLGHVAYYIKPCLFSGDTLFSAGCGRVFEGTSAQMLLSLKKLTALPVDTKIYCGHEYTLNNLRFAALVEPDNLDIQNHINVVEKVVSEGGSSLPSTMALEKKINPFLRCELGAVIESAQHRAGRKLEAEVNVFEVIREWKNHF